MSSPAPNPTSTPPLYTSRLSIPYTHPPLALRTLDLHTLSPTTLHPSYNLLYIHGGAFRDPLCTSTSLTPSLPALFSTKHISAIASVNYRLSPYPGHGEEGEGRNVRWPGHIDDVREGVGWLLRNAEERDGGGGGGGGGWRGKEWIICGHSVGGTMALMLGMEPQLSPDGQYQNHDYGWGHEMRLPGLVGVVGIEGIYDFVACRNAHLGMRDVYDSFTEGAFGKEEEGGWKRGDVRRCGRMVGRGVRVVVLGQSPGDELVEWEQVGGMMGAVKWEGDGEGGRKELVEVQGRHQEVVEGGVGIAKCVGRCVELLVGMEHG